MNVTQNHVGQVHIVANERGGQFRGTVMAVTSAGAVMDVYGQKDGAEWMTLKSPEPRTVRGAQVVSDGR